MHYCRSTEMANGLKLTLDLSQSAIFGRLTERVPSVNVSEQ